ncbi:MAG: hypothetical protein K6A90_00965 [Lachnospiraceae bacterium]|nr:hypothetical protein [Lachnospiraceae bacterium]
MTEILNLSGMYERYDLSSFGEVNFIDLKDTPGTKLYVDPEGEKLIRMRISGGRENKIHLIDIGDYHYITRLYLYYEKEPFDLLVFDNHSDDQAPMIEGLRSCGSWIRDALQDMPEMLISVKLISSMRNIKFLKGSFDKKRPLYISIDKDVLSPDQCKTNWDQGDISLDDMISILKHETEGRKISGFDICGGPAPGEYNDSDIGKNEETDRKLIDFIHQL